LVCSCTRLRQQLIQKYLTVCEIRQKAQMIAPDNSDMRVLSASTVAKQGHIIQVNNFGTNYSWVLSNLITSAFWGHPVCTKLESNTCLGDRTVKEFQCASQS
jgi:hypothetical protein